MAIPLWLVGGVGALALGGFLWQEGQLPGGSTGHAHQAAPRCEVPITLHLEAVDPRFRLERDAVQAALDAAVSMWDGQTPETLFRQREGEGMPVRLVFDERQAGAESRDRARAELDRLKRGIAEREERLDHRHSALAADAAGYQRRLEDLQARQREYGEAVAAWNAGRMAHSAGNRERLERQRRALDSARDDLEQRRRTLERRRDELNREIRELEGEIEGFNQRVAELNREIGATGAFDMAVYEQQGARRSITVFKASDADELRLTLAHELGHALGIEHVDDPAAVMHAMLGEANAGRRDLSDADRRALAAACGVELER
ncbi:MULTISPECIES: matrixin family metalloprotease [unclassified Thioalkalivibrio]|uniref:matrixin family metalloprotease n=1 Tax=unclassified Thioalkalivibrio TaxID=2621013 RepID=UPI0003A0CB17|nr:MULTISPECIES: matrixin family metalloprotease [unclassified Thioalkalivibrio]